MAPTGERSVARSESRPQGRFFICIEAPCAVLRIHSQAGTGNTFLQAFVRYAVHGSITVTKRALLPTCPDLIHGGRHDLDQPGMARDFMPRVEHRAVTTIPLQVMEMFRACRRKVAHWKRRHERA